MKELVYVNPNKKDNCEVCKLNPNWKKVLLNYMSSRYIKCNTYEVHHMHLMLLMIRLLKSMLEIKLINDIDYDDILDNLDDYEYPYNHINRSDL